MRWLTVILFTLAVSPALGQFDDTIEVVRDVVYGKAAGADGEPVPLKLDAAFPRRSDGKPLPALVYIHGGSYNHGSKRAGLPLITAMAEGGYFAVSIDYRLADVAPYPAAVHDCKTAVRFLYAHREELGIDPRRIGVMGHSAGGHLAALLATSANDPALEGDPPTPGDRPTVACVVVVSGPMDFLRYGPRSQRVLRRWLGEDDDVFRRHALEASPLTYVDRRDPPALIVHGTRDRIVPIEHAELLREALSEAGVAVELVVVEGAGHDVRRPDVYGRIAVFFDDHLGGRAAEILPAMMLKAAMERSRPPTARPLRPAE